MSEKRLFSANENVEILSVYARVDVSTASVIAVLASVVAAGIIRASS
jgi:hypothetical protein